MWVLACRASRFIAKSAQFIADAAALVDVMQSVVYWESVRAFAALL